MRQQFWRNLLGLRDEIKNLLQGLNIDDMLGKTRGEWHAAVYDLFKPTSRKVEWAEVIWQRYCVPKRSFVMWMAIQGRLPTKDRLNRFGLLVPTRCCLCREEEEDHHHLFFHCRVAQSILQGVLQRMCLQVHNWSLSLLLGMFQGRRKNKVWRLRAAAIVGCVYNVWRLRNRVLFCNDNVDITNCIFMVCQKLRDRRCSIGVKRSWQTVMIGEQVGLW